METPTPNNLESTEEQLDVDKLEINKLALIQSIQSETLLLLEDEKLLKQQKEELKKLKIKYENQVWERVEVEQTVKKIKENLSLINKKLQDAREAQQTTDILQEKLNKVEINAKQKMKERKILQEQKIKLEADLNLLKKNIIQKSAEISAIAYQLTSEKNTLECKLFNKTNIEDVLLKIYEDTEIISEKLDNEAKKRSHFEIMLRSDIAELHHRYKLQVRAREELQKQLAAGLAVRTTMSTDLKGIKDQVQSISSLNIKVENENQPEEVILQSFPLESKEKLAEVLSSLDVKLNELNSWGEDPVSECKEETLNNLLIASLSEIDVRKKLETTQSSLGNILKVLDQQINEERQLRQQWSLEFESEISAYKQFSEFSSLKL